MASDNSMYALVKEVVYYLGIQARVLNLFAHSIFDKA